MKINKAKLLVGTLAVIATAATVGSISGTVAWFQYSTRSTVAYSGATAHCSENLQVRIFVAESAASANDGYDSGWKSDLRLADVQKYISSAKWRGTSNTDYNLYPITSGNALDAEGKVATSFFKSPIYQYADKYETTDHGWRAATAADYIELPLYFRVLDVNGASSDTYLAKDVYLSNLTINNTSTSPKQDITSALRIGFDAGTGTGKNSVTFSKNGGTINTNGKLDLNADGRVDKEPGYEDFGTLNDFNYGGVASDYTSNALPTETTTKLEKADSSNTGRLWADDSDPENIVGTKMFTTDTSADGVLLTVRIYLEGWQTLQTTVDYVTTDYADRTALDGAKSSLTAGYYKTADNNIYKWDGSTLGTLPLTGGKDNVAVWDDDEFVGAGFQVGMRFSVPAHKDGQE